MNNCNAPPGHIDTHPAAGLQNYILICGVPKHCASRTKHCTHTKAKEKTLYYWVWYWEREELNKCKLITDHLQRIELPVLRLSKVAELLYTPDLKNTKKHSELLHDSISYKRFPPTRLDGSRVQLWALHRSVGIEQAQLNWHSGNWHWRHNYNIRWHRRTKRNSTA